MCEMIRVACADTLQSWEEPWQEVFRVALKTGTKSAEVTCWGRQFRVWVAAIGNAGHRRWKGAWDGLSVMMVRLIVNVDDRQSSSPGGVHWWDRRVPFHADICRQRLPALSLFAVQFSKVELNGAAFGSSTVLQVLRVTSMLVSWRRVQLPSGSIHCRLEPLHEVGTNAGQGRVINPAARTQELRLNNGSNHWSADTPARSWRETTKADCHCLCIFAVLLYSK